MNTTGTTIDRPADIARTAPRPTLPLAGIAVATIAAVLLDVIAYWIADAAGASMKIDSPYDLSVGVVIMASAVPLLIGSAVINRLGRLRPVLARRLAWAGLAVAIVSSVSPFAMADDTATALMLTAMHLIVGAAWAAITLVRPRRSAVRN
ncbi:DUF6069 family protein [Streptomyces sp. NPDC002088]|uniref:DUF6069 family protein n=1 Tax=Streptomyces sp. NPDC002088 TaxID=3154665 RepID=UPI003317D1E4